MLEDDDEPVVALITSSSMTALFSALLLHEMLRESPRLTYPWPHNTPTLN